MLCNITKAEKYALSNCNSSTSLIIYGLTFLGYDDCICHILNDKINVFFILICKHTVYKPRNAIRYYYYEIELFQRIELVDNIYIYIKELFKIDVT